LREFFARHSSDALRGLLAGTRDGAALIPVERDLSPGAVPHSVES
jgi:hypothetical protein